MIFFVFLCIVTCIVFAFRDAMDLNATSSGMLLLFKFIFSLCLGLFIAFLGIMMVDYIPILHYDNIRSFLALICTYIVYIGLEMLIYGKLEVTGTN